MEPIKDLVSVIIPTYNRANLIKRSAESVLNQTYSNLELIVVDDGSTDNTEEVVKSIDDNRVIYIKQSNQGACAARNNGIDHAKGEFIAFQDSDDVWHLDKLEKQVKCLKEKGADVVVCKNLQYVNGKPKRNVTIHNEGFIPKDKPPIWIGTQTFVAKSLVFKEFRFDANVQRWQDFEILVRIHKKYTIYFLSLYLVDYFVQKDSITKQRHNKLLNAWDTILKKNPNIRNEYAHFSELIANVILSETYAITDVAIKQQLVVLAYSFCNNISVKIKYFFGMFKRKVKRLIQ